VGPTSMIKLAESGASSGDHAHRSDKGPDRGPDAAARGPVGHCSRRDGDTEVGGSPVRLAELSTALGVEDEVDRRRWRALAEADSSVSDAAAGGPLTCFCGPPVADSGQWHARRSGVGGALARTKGRDVAARRSSACASAP
jgi:hypothetical protein